MSRSYGQRTALVLGIGGIFLGLLTALISCSESFTPEPIEERPTVAIQGLEVSHIDENGLVTWKLIAKTGQFFEAQQQTIASEVELLFLNTEGEAILNLQSDSLIYHNRTGNLEMSGNIYAEDITGKRFTTDEAIWEESTKKLYGNAPVEAEQENIKVSGGSFTYDTEAKRLYINQAHFEWTPPDGGEPR